MIETIEIITASGRKITKYVIAGVHGPTFWTQATAIAYYERYVSEIEMSHSNPHTQKISETIQAKFKGTV